MVNISFQPALRVETRVRPAIQGDATISATFYASLDLSEWQRFEKNGACVELWSDIPTNGRAAGMWGATQFMKVHLEGNQVQLEASLVTLSSRGTQARYSYTYRVRQTTGEVQWLGNASSNGHLVIEPEAFWSGSEESVSTMIGTIHWAARWRAWLVSPEHAPASLKLLSLDPRETSPAGHTLLLVPGSSRREVSNPPSLIIHSDGAPISITHGKVYCETPKDVIVQTMPEGGSVTDALKAYGITSIPTSHDSTFFVLSSSRAPGQSSTSFHPIWLSPRIPTAVEILSSDIKSIIGQSGTVVIYPPGPDYSQPLLMNGERHEIPLGHGTEPLRAVLLHSIPDWTSQFVGIASPSTMHQVLASPSPSTQTLIEVDATAPTTVQSKDDNVTKNIATVTVSKSSTVLFARTMPVPDTITSQMERLFRFKLLYTFYRLALYIVSLVIPFLGINLSLKISPTKTIEKHKPEKEVEVKEKPLPTSTETKVEPQMDNSLYYNVEPVGGEVNVTFLGDAADEVTFTIDGKSIDPWTVVQTWHGDDLHQFLLRMDTPARLGISIQTPTSQ